MERVDNFITLFEKLSSKRMEDKHYFERGYADQLVYLNAENRELSTESVNFKFKDNFLEISYHYIEDGADREEQYKYWYDRNEKKCYVVDTINMDMEEITAEDMLTAIDYLVTKNNTISFYFESDEMAYEDYQLLSVAPSNINDTIFYPFKSWDYVVEDRKNDIFAIAEEYRNGPREEGIFDEGIDK